MSRSCGYGKGSMNFNLCTDCGYCTRKKEREQKLAAEGKCITCKGEGSVMKTGRAWNTGQAHTYHETCSVCKGTGLLNPVKNTKRINKKKAVAVFDELLELATDKDKDKAQRLRRKFTRVMNIPKSKEKKK